MLCDIVQDLGDVQNSGCWRASRCTEQPTLQDKPSSVLLILWPGSFNAALAWMPRLSSGPLEQCRRILVATALVLNFGACTIKQYHSAYLSLWLRNVEQKALWCDPASADACLLDTRGLGLKVSSFCLWGGCLSSIISTTLICFCCIEGLALPRTGIL